MNFLRNLALLLGFAAWAFGVPAWAQPPESAPAAPQMLQRMRARAAGVRAFEATVHLTRADPRFLRAFYAPARLNLEGVVSFQRPDDFDLTLHQGGSRWYRFDSREGFGLRFSALVRLGAGTSTFPPSLHRTPDPDLGFEDFTQDAADQHAFHPLAFLWPPEFWDPVPGQVASFTGTERLFGRQCLKVLATRAGGGELRFWLDRTSYEALRVEAVPGGGGVPIMADYRRRDPSLPTWSEVEVQANHRPLYVARMVAPTLEPRRSRLPDLSLVLRKPAGHKAGGGAARVPLPDWVQGVLASLAVVLVLLLARFLYHAFRRQVFAEEVILLDTPDGLWGRRLARLGYPTVEFSLETVTEELRALGRGITVESTRPPRAIVVAPDACADVRAHRFLLKSFVEEGGRVLMLAHSDPRTLPFEAGMVEIPEASIRRIFFEPSGPWHRISPDEAAAVTSSLGCGLYFSSLDGRLVDVELVGFQSHEGLQGTAIGVARRGLGEWLLCQVRFPLSAVGRKTEAGRLLRDLLDLLQGRRELEDEDIWGAGG